VVDFRPPADERITTEMTTSETRVSTLSPQQARALWRKLRQHFTSAESVIKEIIAERAWEPLGYTSFAEAWDDTMRDVTLAPELRAHVVYQMFDEGCTDEEVTETVHGVGPAVAESLRQEKSHGVPPERARTMVRRHHRMLPERKGILKIEVGTDTLKTWRRIASEHGMTVQEIALPAIEAAFEALA
jgi:hypothetical protein